MKGVPCSSQGARTSTKIMSSVEQPEKEKLSKKQFPTKPEDFFLTREEHILDYLMEKVGRSFKEIGRMIINKQASVEIVTNQETEVRSAIVRKDGKIIFLTSNEQEIEILKLLDKGENYIIEYFMSENQEKSSS